MNGFLLGAALFVGIPLVVGLHRVWSGPTVFDRLLAVALVTANTLVILVLAASAMGRIDGVVDIALGYALLTFVLPIALGKYFELRRRAEAAAGNEERP